ncbi:hypothetical protein [Endozoicomonas sp. SCSIO W0465]|nr:hypothetical protein [Endozoicomonas sp. SCSIO W0465]
MDHTLWYSRDHLDQSWPVVKNPEISKTKIVTLHVKQFLAS